MKNFLATVRANKKLIVKRTLIVGGAVAGLALAFGIAKHVKDSDDETVLDAVIDAEIID